MGYIFLSCTWEIVASQTFLSTISKNEYIFWKEDSQASSGSICLKSGLWYPLANEFNLNYSVLNKNKKNNYLFKGP